MSKELVKQYLQMGPSLSNEQISKLSKNDIKSWIRVRFRLAMDFEETDVTLDDGEFKLGSEEDKLEYINNLLDSPFDVIEAEWDWMKNEMRDRYIIDRLKKKDEYKDAGEDSDELNIKIFDYSTENQKIQYIRNMMLHKINYRNLPDYIKQWHKFNIEKF